MKKRIITALLLCAMLVGCGAETTDKETTGTADTAVDAAETVQETEIWDNVPAGSYDGYGFRFLTTEENWGYYRMDVEEQTGEVLDDAVFARNLAVEDRLGIVITETGLHYSKVMDEVKATVLASEDAYDAMTLMAFNLMTTAQQKMLLDTAALSAIRTDMPWWNGNAIRDMAIGPREYMMIGDINLMFYESYYAIFFNKTVADKFQIPDPYATVDEGKWTYDVYYSTAQAASTDVNGDGEWTADADTYGVAMHSNAGQSMILALGQSPLSRDADGYPVYDGLSEAFIDAYRKVMTLYTDKHTTVKSGTAGVEKVDGGYQGVFKTDRALYMMEVLGTLPELRDMESEFGIVVLPKADEGAEYVSPVYHGAIGLCVPVTVSDADRTGVVLENLAAESNRTVRGMYYDVVLGSKLVRDEASVASLDTILDSGRFEIGYVYNWGDMRSALEQNIGKGNADIASAFAKISAKIESGIAADIAVFNE
mgnify:CR=1 FL=1